MKIDSWIWIRLLFVYIVHITTCKWTSFENTKHLKWPAAGKKKNAHHSKAFAWPFIGPKSLALSQTLFDGYAIREGSGDTTHLRRLNYWYLLIGLAHFSYVTAQMTLATVWQMISRCIIANKTKQTKKWIWIIDILEWQHEIFIIFGDMDSLVVTLPISLGLF